MLNGLGCARAADLACAFSDLLIRAEAICGADGREMALLRTHLQDAAAWGRRALGSRPDLLATFESKGVEHDLHKVIDDYDSALTGVRVMLSEFGAPEAINGRRLSYGDRIRALFAK